MKKFILAAAVMMVSLGAFAGNDEHGDKYCGKLRDGKIVVMHDGDVITSDVTLTDGSIVKPDGSVVMKDGSKMMLNDGECINKDGSTTIKIQPK